MILCIPLPEGGVGGRIAFRGAIMNRMFLALAFWMAGGSSRPVVADERPPAASRPVASAPVSRIVRVASLREAFLWGFVLFLVFLVGAGVIIRFSVRYRGVILSKPRVPTPDADVWKMHRLPGQAEPPGPGAENGGTDGRN